MRRSVKVSKELKFLRKQREANERESKRHQYDCPSCSKDLRVNSSKCALLCDGYENFFCGKRTWYFNCVCGVNTQVVVG